MFDVTNKICKYKGCSALPIYNHAGISNAIFCLKHKSRTMVNVRNRKCLFDGCDISANYNFKEEKGTRFCSVHKLEGMICKSNKKCEQRKCNLKANYNYKGELKPKFCSKHKRNGMCSLYKEKCAYTGCDKQPSYNLEGKGRLFCLEHKLDGMINVRKKLCPKCATWIDFQYANKKYDDYCARCFQQFFPKDPRTFQIRRKTKEIKVRDYINSNFEGFIHDRVLYTHGCDCPSRRRIDHRILINNTMLAIETDEHQHRSYDPKNEEIRHDDVYMHYSGKWIWIRFNPDSYKDKNGVGQKLDIEDRLPVLKEMIEKQMERIKKGENNELMEIYKLFYDEC